LPSCVARHRSAELICRVGESDSTIDKDPAGRIFEFGHMSNLAFVKKRRKLGKTYKSITQELDSFDNEQSTKKSYVVAGG